MKKAYTEPQIKVIEIEVNDIIATSGGDPTVTNPDMD